MKFIPLLLLFFSFSSFAQGDFLNIPFKLKVTTNGKALPGASIKVFENYPGELFQGIEAGELITGQDGKTNTPLNITPHVKLYFVVTKNGYNKVVKSIHTPTSERSITASFDLFKLSNASQSVASFGEDINSDLFQIKIYNKPDLSLAEEKGKCVVKKYSDIYFLSHRPESNKISRDTLFYPPSHIMIAEGVWFSIKYRLNPTGASKMGYIFYNTAEETKPSQVLFTAYIKVKDNVPIFANLDYGNAHMKLKKTLKKGEIFKVSKISQRDPSDGSYWLYIDKKGWVKADNPGVSPSLISGKN